MTWAVPLDTMVTFTSLVNAWDELARPFKLLIPALPPLAVANDHVFKDVQTYKFCPGGAFTLKNVSAVEQIAGKVAPDLNGFVVTAEVQSIFLDWVRRSTCVWHIALPAKQQPAINIR